MRLPPLIPIFTALAAALLPLLFRLGEKKGANVDVYAMPKALRIFLWCVTVAIAIWLLSQAYLDTKMPPYQWWAFGGFDAVFIGVCVYTDRYRVRLTESALEMTEFRTECVPYSSISSVEVVSSGGGTEHLVVIFSGSERLVISGYIGYFDRLGQELKLRVAGAKACKPPPP